MEQDCLSGVAAVEHVLLSLGSVDRVTDSADLGCQSLTHFDGQISGVTATKFEVQFLSRWRNNGCNLIEKRNRQRRGKEVMKNRKRRGKRRGGSGPINAPSNDLENSRCALLNWNNYEEDEVVAEGMISSTNPSTKVHCVPLGRNCWKVWVDVVFDEYQTMEVYRLTMDAKQLGEAIGSTLAWPKSSIEMLP